MNKSLFKAFAKSKKQIKGLEKVYFSISKFCKLVKGNV